MDGNFSMNYGNQNMGMGGYNVQNGMNTIYGNQNMTTNQNQQNYSRPKQRIIIGRQVYSENEIMAQEVPMDSIVVFVKNDLQEIYLKAWGNDGGIHTNNYILSTADGIAVEQGQNPNDKLDYILDRLNQIESKLGSKPVYKNNHYRKGGNRNESKANDAVRNITTSEK